VEILSPAFVAPRFFFSFFLKGSAQTSPCVSIFVDGFFLADRIDFFPFFISEEEI